MTLHLLKDSPNSLALSVLGSQLSPQASPSVVVLLPPATAIPALPHCTTYHLMDHASTKEKDAISYSRLVEMVFQAEKVIAW
ncbi:MAG TPA: hypothetical protein VF879_02525 [Nitrospirales bacterium]